MKANYFFKAAFGMALVCSMTVACTNDDDLSGSTTVNDGDLQFNVVDEGVSAGVGSKATMDADYKTTFEAGDSLGLIAVQNGAVVDSISNLPLVYDGSKWTLPKTIKFNSKLNGVNFYAYAPYDKDIVTSGLFNPASETPFSDAVAAATVTLDQSTQEAYEKNDMMTTGGITVNQETHEVTLTLNHAFALVSVELPSASYNFPNLPDLGNYTYSQAKNVEFMLDGAATKPYLENNRYNLILKPAASTRSLEVNFTNGTERYKQLTIANSASLKDGQYAYYKIDGGVSVTYIELNSGDFFMKDGTIVSKDAQTVDAANVAGVIFAPGTTGTPDKHALVVGLTESTGPWGGFSSTSAEDNAAGWNYWFDDYGISDVKDENGSRVSDINKLTWDILNASGLDNTNAWYNIPTTSLTLGDITKYVTAKDENTDGFKAIAENYRSNVAKPSAATEWYVPSLLEMRQVNESIDAINASLAKVSGTGITLPGSYWTSNIRSAAIIWGYVGAASYSASAMPSDYLKTFKLNENHTYRFILAF